MRGSLGGVVAEEVKVEVGWRNLVLLEQFEADEFVELDCATSVLVDQASPRSLRDSFGSLTRRLGYVNSGTTRD
jgi:hypothetical protein